MPGSAESTHVAALADRFPGANTSLAAVVFARDDGRLTAADRAAVARARKQLTRFVPDRRIAPPRQSTDGRALLLSVPLRDGDQTADQVKDIRGVIAEDAPPGLQAKVAGPAAQAADMAAAFKGLDGKLLLVAGAAVAVLLLVIYRSPVLWLLPLISAAAANEVATGVVYLLAKHAGLMVNGQTQGILAVLVFGIATDYALLLIARYREELHRQEDRHLALAVALRRAGPAILASSATVILGLLCLLVAELGSNHDLGPACAIGVGCGVVVLLTLLPALLVLCGRWVFWPFTPRVSDVAAQYGGWHRLAAGVGRRPRLIAVSTVVVLGALAIGLTGLKTGLTVEQSYTKTVPSVAAQRVVAAHFPAGESAPAQIVTSTSAQRTVAAAAGKVEGVSALLPAQRSTDGRLVRLPAVLTDPSDSAAARDTVDRLRSALPDGALVGGPSATDRDMRAAWSHDDRVVMPLILGVVLLVLTGLLRSLVAPLLLVATVVLSYAAALGASTLLFSHVFGFAGLDSMVPLLGFLFLVALGVDYNIFLMTRVREEAGRIGHRAGVLRGLAVTGGVITSAGVVLAATFVALGVLPLVAMAEIGVLVALGVLLDTLLVRSLLVPALAMLTGRRIWWPSRHAATVDADRDRQLTAV